MLFLSDVEEIILMNGRSWSLSLKFENHDTVIMPSRKEVDFWMRSNDPKPVIFSFEGLYSSALIQIPNADCLVLSNRQY